MWWPIQQIYCISMISQTCAFFDYRMGDTGYVTESGLARQFHTPARALYGEVMLSLIHIFPCFVNFFPLRTHSNRVRS